jgi:ABC-type Fe3+ transport system substrate-binding protein
MTYMSPLYQQLRDDPRPPLYAAELLVSDAPLPCPWFGTTSATRDSRRFNQKSIAGDWLQAHELIQAHYEGRVQIWAWTRKGELYRARIRANGISSVEQLWQWAKAGNKPSVWHLERRW